MMPMTKHKLKEQVKQLVLLSRAAGLDNEAAALDLVALAMDFQCVEQMVELWATLADVIEDLPEEDASEKIQAFIRKRKARWN